MRPLAAFQLWLFVDSTGRVTRSRVRESSGVAAVDSVPLRVTSHMLFEPALANRRPTGVWVSQWFTLEALDPEESTTD